MEIHTIKTLTSAAVLCLLGSFSTTQALADSTPALLGVLDSAHVQPLDVAEQTRGKYFVIDIDSPDSVVYEAEAYCSAYRGLGFRCTGNYGTAIAGYSAFYGIEVNTGNSWILNVFNIPKNRTFWKKY